MSCMSRRPTIVAPTILPAFLAGSVAGATGCVVGHPFDLLKVVQQTSEKNKSLFAAARAATAQGPLGLFRGIGPALAAQVGTSALLFGGQTYINNLCGKTALGSCGNSAVSGFLIGALMSPMTALLEGYKCRAQVRPSREYLAAPSTPATLKLTARAAFRGISATAMRCSFGNAAYFGAYSAIDGALGPFVGGAVAGVAFWVVGMPFDVIKSCMQTAPLWKLGSTPRFLSTARAILLKRGPQGFYAGLPVTLLRAAPMQAVVFYTYEIAIEWAR